MKRRWLVLVVLGSGVMAHAAWVETGGYSGTYVDAIPEGMVGANTRPADPLITDWLIDGSSDPTKWRWRDTEIIEGVYDNAALESNSPTTAVGDRPMLTTIISGLISGVEYNMYVVYWDDDGADALELGTDAWTVLAGLDPASLSRFSSDDGTETGTGRSREQYEAYLGTAFADVNGEIKVYIDDLPDATSSINRTMYDGVVYSEVPEPATLLLLGAGLAVTSRVRTGRR